MKKVCIFLLTLATSIPLVSCNEEDLGLPFYESDAEIVRHTGFVLKYSELHEQPAWVAYHLTATEVESEEHPRRNNFREDPAVSTGSATKADYSGSGYERGHLAPAEDFEWSREAMDDCFYLSNISPQIGSFNRGVWVRLENKVRSWALENDEIFIVTGPVLTDGSYENLQLGSRVAIPKRFFKVVLDLKEPETKAIGFILKHEQSGDALGTFAFSIDEVERVTGLDFFHLLLDETEESLESSHDLSLWPGLN